MLREIHAADEQRQSADTMGWGLISVALMIGPVIALIVATFSACGRLRAGTVLLIMLALLALGSPVCFVASFPVGMTLADASHVGGADHAPWAIILRAASILSILTLAGLLIAQAVRASRGPTTRAV